LVAEQIEKGTGKKKGVVSATCRIAEPEKITKVPEVVEKHEIDGRGHVGSELERVFFSTEQVHAYVR